MKKYISVILLIIVVVVSAGCSKDFLETSPTDAVSPSDALSTPENMMLVLNGIHRTMYSQAPFADFSLAGEGYIMPMLEFTASDAIHTADGNGWFRDARQWLDHTNPTTGEIEWIWYHYYHIIGNVNQIINAAEGMPEDEILSNVLGQAKAYRAYAHFRLVSVFAKNYGIGNPATDLGIPIMTVTEAPYEGMPRATVAEVYMQIMADLNQAIAHFGTASSRADNSHLSLEVAQGLAARVALTMENWTDAAAFANAARQGYGLMSETEYKSGFNSFTGTEVMWGGNILMDQTTYYRAYFYYIGTNFNGSQNRGNPKMINHALYGQISATDYRRDMWLETAPNTFIGWEADPNYASSAAFEAAYDQIILDYEMTSSFNTAPYMSVKFRNSNGGSIDPDDLFYMRVSEMYLIEAEALAQDGQDAAAALVLFDLVSERDPGYVLSTNTGAALMDEIKIQRRIELWGEGHRFLDMLRWDEELDRSTSGADAGLYAAGMYQARPSLNVNWVWQIPQAEIDANPNIGEAEQNPSASLTN